MFVVFFFSFSFLYIGGGETLSKIILIGQLYFPEDYIITDFQLLWFFVLFPFGTYSSSFRFTTKMSLNKSLVRIKKYLEHFFKFWNSFWNPF